MTADISLNLMSSQPLIKPQTVANTTQNTIATAIGTPTLYNTAITTEDNATMDATEISMSPQHDHACHAEYYERLVEEVHRRTHDTPKIQVVIGQRCVKYINELKR
jgi:hypothetical protein